MIRERNSTCRRARAQLVCLMEVPSSSFGWSGLVGCLIDSRQLQGVGVPTIRRVEIIGAGRTSPAHIRALRRLSHIEITGVLDINSNAARAIADRFGIRQYSGPERFYRDARPETVHILTPPHTHEMLADEAIGRGVHVLTEKPPALTVAACEALQRKAEAASVTIGVNENFAFDPRVRSAREEIVPRHPRAAGSHQRLLRLRCSCGRGRPEQLVLGEGAARRHPRNLLPHPLTVARTLAAEELLLIHRHVVRSGRLPFLLDDEMRLLLTGRSGLTVQLTLSLSTRPATFIVIIYGTRATLRMDLQKHANLAVARRHPIGAVLGGLASDRAVHSSPSPNDQERDRHYFVSSYQGWRPGLSHPQSL